MKDLGRTHVPDELLDHGFAGKAEFMDAALDGRGSELQTQPVVKEFLDLAPREAEAERQCRDEGGEHRAHQAALAQLQIPPTALDLRARPDAGAGDGLVAARTAHGEVDVFGRRDLKSHFAAEEFEAVMGATLPKSIRSAAELYGPAKKKAKMRNAQSVMINVRR